MKIIKILKKISPLVSLVRELRRIGYRLTRSQVIKNYLRNDHPKKLHIGSGSHSLEGWLNTDLFPLNKNILFLDATTAFPFPDQIFDYIFSEHQIEHIHYYEAAQMLRECHRILKLGGKIRIGTPSLQFFTTPFDQQKLEYVHFISDVYIKQGFHQAKNYIPINSKYLESFVINDIFYNYDHKFIYDFETIKDLLESCGFADIKSCSPNMSLDQHLQNIDRAGNGMESLSTMIIEATK